MYLSPTAPPSSGAVVFKAIAFPVKLYLLQVIKINEKIVTL
jgi:hypothetical protein